jgi:hypothetical protein
MQTNSLWPSDCQQRVQRDLMLNNAGYWELAAPDGVWKDACWGRRPRQPAPWNVDSASGATTCDEARHRPRRFLPGTGRRVLFV